MLIDMHAHVIPAEFPSWAAEQGWPTMGRADAHGARLLTAGPLRFTAQSAFFDAERRLAAMDASEVTAEVVSPMPPLLNYRLPAASGRDLSRWINEFVAALCRAEPTRLFGLGTVPLQDPDLAAAELAEVAGLGLAGVEIGSNIEGVCIGDDRLADFFAEAERLGLAVFVHALNPTMAARLPAGANATFGFATEISVAAASLAASGTAARCPRLRLAFSHGAGGFPLMLTRAQYFWGRTWNEETPAGPGSGSGGDGPDGPSPSDLARRFYYDTLVFDRRALTYLIDMLGPSRLLIGSDFPAMPREQPAGRTLRSMGLPPDVLADITWNNCLRFLGIGSPDALAG